MRFVISLKWAMHGGPLLLPYVGPYASRQVTFSIRKVQQMR
jgi:hypothetical protein